MVNYGCAVDAHALHAFATGELRLTRLALRPLAPPCSNHIYLFSVHAGCCWGARGRMRSGPAGPVAPAGRARGCTRVHGILATRDAMYIWEESVGRRAMRWPFAVFCLFRLTAYSASRDRSRVWLFNNTGESHLLCALCCLQLRQM